MLQELTSQELRGANPYPNASSSNLDKSVRSEEPRNLTANRPTSYHESSSKHHGERPAPQGGSIDQEAPALTRKKDNRREASRTRHLSGERRSASSSSKYNSYSSDERGKFYSFFSW